ncbi:MAG: hypothetical protein K0Q95_867 [Bacteroidota bacterium]|jgi:hypothetical protein|nr:hypothetical protein [Bacteroidota bacterium]
MLRKIQISRSEIYPEIVLDKESGIFEIKGISLPENGKDFYQPVLEFLEEYVTEPNEVTHFVFNLRYFNISSSKMILFLLYKLKELQDAGKKVVITWCYDDEDIHEAGKDFEHMVTLPFQFKEVYFEKVAEA